jgi:flagellar capping protein FliD
VPTQEERLTTVEYDLKHFKTETIKAYGDMAMELVMVKGLTEDAVKRLASLKTQIEQRFEQVGTRLDAMDAHLASMDTRLNRVETLLTQILARLPEKP